MRPENVGKLEKLKTISRYLRKFTRLILVVLPFCLVIEDLVVLFGQNTSIDLLDMSYPIAGEPFRVRVALIVVMDLFLVVAFKRLYHLFKLFGNYSSGEVFTTDSARQIRQIGITAVLVGGLNMLTVFVPPALLAHSPHAIKLSLLAAFHGVVTIAISWIMEMAAELREENELTV